ncbi:MAG: heterodisulfide reductase subunit C [Gaiellales bacterium]|nr:MAG: heterodisulfide reductase subunit C [Gaiellales bacterium]
MRFWRQNAMIKVSQKVTESAGLIAEIERRTGQRISDCYQCGRCTSTCAGSFAFDRPPHVLMRMLQLGRVQEAMESKTAQLCYDCMTCSSRCPMNIDVAFIIETVSNIAHEQGVKYTIKSMDRFRKLFLHNVRRHGRLHEASLLASYNLRSLQPRNDFSLAPLILKKKKKFHFFPPRIRDRAEVRRIFEELERDPDYGRGFGE